MLCPTYINYFIFIAEKAGVYRLRNGDRERF
jgi:hypothetical protein